MANFKIISVSFAGLLAFIGVNAAAEDRPATDNNKAKAAQNKKDAKTAEKKGKENAKKNSKAQLEKKKQEWASGSD